MPCPISHLKCCSFSPYSQLPISYSPFLPRRPVKHSSAQNVDMEMKHRLAGPRSVIDDGAEPFRIDVALARQLSRDGEEMSQEWFIFLLGFSERSDVLSRNE